MVMATFVSRGGRGECHRESPATILDRMRHTVASVFKRRADGSLVNAQFSDALERELAARALQNKGLL